MKSKLTRREFLKLATALPLAPLAGSLPAPKLAGTLQYQSHPNVIILIFDALSAAHLSLYGYPRHTSPNLERLSRRATVYHNHHSAANFTTASTASLFTGTYPWTHRSFGLESGIIPSLIPHNVFRSLEGIYRRVVFIENLLADSLVFQFTGDIDRHVKLNSFTVVGNTFYDALINRDSRSILESFDKFLFKGGDDQGSLFLGPVNSLGFAINNNIYSQKFTGLYPNGLPLLDPSNVFFLMGQVIDGLMGLLDELQKQSVDQPFLAYIHLMPPHSPYTPTSRFLGEFNDHWTPPAKPKHRLVEKKPEDEVNRNRLAYDQFVANVDAEFGRLLDHLEKSGLLENSYLIVTSDHGELFERGFYGHGGPLLFEDVIRVPLIISSPGQSQPQEIHTLTSNIDLLPSLMKIASLPSPDWCEGEALPGLGGQATAGRSILSIEGKRNQRYKPLSQATIALLQGQLKLIYYMGYPEYKYRFELYDLKEDPGEMHNLYPDHSSARQLKAELLEKLKIADDPYQQKT